ncbi:fimbrial protein [Providencia rettgeri]|uniref:fimbrial protein n=1 Tax=Providencia rettgeri TaxID=587 RepID=UPI001BAC7E72|nr:fimbrial protein [Providencia rettgeri]ELR5100304.1 type 1 fimbrial protein [Providencia rettgeri]ELT5688319.1 type 1 fimbrial protein [Providencia rettgeri]MBS0861619.1 type 1 fimbrial protein [Providencia rettgeri]MBS0875530.1 type 1 fimbrial protein [Providencia rettgeri]MBS0918418.1 type 1 fimbrial protein [Providencia rettgeri]
MNAISISTVLILSQLIFLPYAQADSSPNVGRVSMNGSIVNSACAIDTGSYEQTVDMGFLPVGTIHQEGQGPVHPFSITLIGCTLDPYAGDVWQTFSVTFDGPVNGEWFSVSGEARGIALSLQDVQGQKIYPGQSTPKQAIVAGNSVLHYGLRLVSDSHPLRPGEYQSTLRFKLEYY